MAGASVLALVLFGLASLACAFADTSGQLLAAGGARRRRGGHGAAVHGRASSAVSRAAGTGRAMSIWVAATSLGLPLGPVLGGWLVRLLLVGFGLPDQRADGGGRRGGDGRAGAGIA
ncbi:hypothetical protein ACFYT3_18960 [Nocardia amikacinitolerans]|uniref:hypothetical protein n=1 Tax=Nocardia amikacinitolerans TaxID=756689 RepID=UPI0020A28007|nr:hypothetical protein [Nocardia amikacinitolerans]